MKQIISFYLSFAIASCLFANNTAFGQQSNKKSIEIAMPVSSTTVKETYLNTVSTTASDGTKYKLTIIGDELPKFYVNGALINSNDLGKYNELIDKLTPVLWQRQKDAAEAQKKENLKVTSAILKELSDKYNRTNIESFLLSGKEFIINKQVQNNEMFLHFWNEFGKTPDAIYYYEKN